MVLKSYHYSHWLKKQMIILYTTSVRVYYWFLLDRSLRSIRRWRNLALRLNLWLGKTLSCLLRHIYLLCIFLHLLCNNVPSLNVVFRGLWVCDHVIINRVKLPNVPLVFGKFCWLDDFVLIRCSILKFLTNINEVVEWWFFFWICHIYFR